MMAKNTFFQIPGSNRCQVLTSTPHFPEGQPLINQNIGFIRKDASLTYNNRGLAFKATPLLYLATPTMLRRRALNGDQGRSPLCIFRALLSIRPQPENGSCHRPRICKITYLPDIKIFIYFLRFSLNG